jgi:rhodanese-related sulfurtransferase
MRRSHSAVCAAPEPAGSETLPECAIADLPDRLARGDVLLDLRPSAAFREAHIEGARWAIRPRLEALALQPDTELILAGERGVAEHAAIDLRALGHERLSRLPGGPEEWREAELAVVAAPDEPPDAARIDYLFFVHDRHHGNLEAARAYLEWETALTDQLDEQERSVFTLDF